MLVCSCNFITEAEIEEVVTELLDEDCWRIIVPGTVYNRLEKRGRCCGCFPNVIDIIVRTSEAYHRERDSTGDEICDFLNRLKAFQEHKRRTDIERRQKGHRAVKRSALFGAGSR